jgi:tryptophan synthase alpha subunit
MEHQETRERVQRLLSAERERRQNVPSYLMTYYKEIYR